MENKEQMSSELQQLLNELHPEQIEKSEYYRKVYEQILAIFDQMSTEEITEAVNNTNFGITMWLSHNVPFKIAQKIQPAREVKAAEEVSDFIKACNSEKALNYILSRRKDEIEMLLINACAFSRWTPQQINKKELNKCIRLLEEIIYDPDCARSDTFKYEKVQSALIKNKYYKTVDVDDDAICEYIIGENGVRQKFDKAILAKGNGFAELAQEERLENKILMTIDFAVNYSKTTEFTYDDAFELFVRDFLGEQIFDSTISGMPVRTVVKNVAPYIHTRYCEINNRALGSYKDRGDIVKTHIITEMFLQDIESKRKSYTETPSTK